MKSRFVVLLSLLLALVGASACGDDDSDNGDKGAVSASPEVKKVIAASANAQGLKGRSEAEREGGGANRILPGQEVTTDGIKEHMVKTIKEQTGLDVTIDCPPKVQYGPGVVFYCKLHLPDGTTMDIKCTMQPTPPNENVVPVEWEILATQPVPQPPSGGLTSKLKETSGDERVARGRAANALQTGDTLDISNLGEAIEQAIEQQINENVAVECPPTVEYAPGSRFYCKLYTNDNTIYDVECTQGENGEISWRVLAR